MSRREDRFIPDARRLVDHQEAGFSPERTLEDVAFTIFYRGALRSFQDVQRAFSEIADKASSFGWESSSEFAEKLAVLHVFVTGPDRPMEFSVLSGKKYSTCDGFFRCPVELRGEVFAVLDVAEGFFTHFEVQDARGFWDAHLRSRSGAKRLALRPLTEAETMEMERGFDLPPLSHPDGGFDARAFDPPRRAELCAGFLRLVRKDCSDDLAAPIDWNTLCARAHAAHDEQSYPELGGYWHDVVIVLEYWANTCLRGRDGKPLRTRSRGVAPGYLLGWCLVEAMRGYSDSSFGAAHDRIERFRYDLHSKRWVIRSVSDFMRYAFTVMEYLGFYRSDECRVRGVAQTAGGETDTIR